MDYDWDYEMGSNWDKATPDNSHRGFVSPFTVQYTGAQRDRFGSETSQDIRDMLFQGPDEVEDYPEDFQGEWEDFPRVSRLRKNLTALSQHHNLYFVAYRSWIHVYVPGRGGDLVTGRPLAILNPALSRTPVSAWTPGHIEHAHPESVNHLRVGDFGDKEILLAARDNGDVVAWYTDTIARAVEQRRELLARREDEEYRPPEPRHFFAECVGNSAWGLAIHSRDRLIAVSSNNKEVTVFAFALSGDEADAQFEDYDKPHDPVAAEGAVVGEGASRWALGTDPKSSQSQAHSKSAGDRWKSLGQNFRTRKRSWRIILPMGPSSDKLTSVSFCENEAGHADRVAAIDMCGFLWIAEIWTLAGGPVRFPPHNVRKPSRRSEMLHPVGWNVLAITDAQLLPTQSMKQAIGLNPKDAVRRGIYSKHGTWIDTSGSMVAVPDNAAVSKHEEYSAYLQQRWPDEDSTHGPLPLEFYEHSLADEHEVDKVFKPAHVEDEDEEIKLRMIMVPATGDHYAEFKDLYTFDKCIGPAGAFDRQQNMPNPACGYKIPREESKLAMLRNISFLRANQEDVEMLTLDGPEHDVGQVCHHVLTNTNINLQHHVTPWDMRHSERCSMLLTIPELHLVVLGSMCGRVALLTLTKPPPTLAAPKLHDLARRPRRAFRVDSVLPFKSEEDNSQRPHVCLLGIAVSPVPETGRVVGMRWRRPTAYGGRRRGAGAPPEMEPEAPRRWRLLLYYMDHTILQYEITKKASAGDGHDAAADDDDDIPMELGGPNRASGRGIRVSTSSPPDVEKGWRLIPRSKSISQLWFNGYFDEDSSSANGSDAEDEVEGDTGEVGGME